ARAPLPPPPPLQPANAPGRAVARRAAVVGGEPVLLSDQYSRQGCPEPVALPRARSASAVDPAHRRPRRPAGGRGRHRGVAPPGGSDGREAPGPDRTAFPPARRALRRGCVRAFLWLEAMARGGGGLAHRDVRAADREGAAGGNAEPLPVGGSRGTAVLQESAHTSAARRGVRARPGDGARSVAEVVATLERRYGAAGEGGVERDVTAFLDGLAAKGLVTYGS